MSNDIDIFWDTTVFRWVIACLYFEKCASFEITGIQICLSNCGFQIVKCFFIVIRRNV